MNSYKTNEIQIPLKEADAVESILNLSDVLFQSFSGSRILGLSGKFSRTSFSISTLAADLVEK